MADPYDVPVALVRALHETHGLVGLLWAHHDGPCKVVLPESCDAHCVGATMAEALHRAAAVTLPPAMCAGLGVVPEADG